MPHLFSNTALQQVWDADIGSAGGSDAALLSSPVVAENKVFTIDVENVVSAFDSSSGKDLWDIEIEGGDEDINLSGGLSFYKGQLFVTTGFAQIYSLDSSNGNIIWENTVSAPIRSSPLIYDDKIIVITIENQVFAFNYKDGKREGKGILTYHKESKYKKIEGEWKNNDIWTGTVEYADGTKAEYKNGKEDKDAWRYKLSLIHI